MRRRPPAVPRAPWISRARARPLERPHEVDVAREAGPWDLPYRGPYHPQILPYRRSRTWQHVRHRRLQELGPVPVPLHLETDARALLRRTSLPLGLLAIAVVIALRSSHVGVWALAGLAVAAALLGLGRALRQPLVEIEEDGVRVHHLLLGTPSWIDRARILGLVDHGSAGMYLSVRGDPRTFRLPVELLSHEDQLRLAQCLTHYNTSGTFA